jgi:hypothetical protein
MSESQPDSGVFVASLSTDDWEPDPDVGGLMHIMCDLPGLQAGFTRFDIDPAPVSWRPLQRETFVILEGTDRIHIVGGGTLDLAPGDAATLEAGTDTTWHITTPFREFWVLSGPSIEQ